MSDVALIVGAGPTGLALAIELTLRQMPVRLIDRSDHPARWSQALVVQARTLEQFERYGIAKQAVDSGRKIREARLFHAGRRILRFSFDRIPGRYPYVLFLPQNETEALLITHLESLGVTVERGVELTALSQDSGGVQAVLRKKDGTEERGSFRWLAGCDGAHSTVREQLKVPFIGDTVGLHFFLGDVAVSGPDVTEDEISIHLRHGDVLFMAQLTETLHRLIVANHAEQGASADREPTLEDFQKAVDSYGLRIRVESVNWKAPFHINQRKAEHYRVGNTFLAGDASHIHSPVAGQGMNTGIQDAANLGWKLAAVAQGAPERLLDSYEEERGKVGDQLLRRTSGGLEAAVTANPVLELLRDVAGSVASHLPMVQDAAVGFVSETAITYRGSSIAEDHAGRGAIHAGDRVPNPDVLLPDGERVRLLDGLRSGQPLLLTYGCKDSVAIEAAAPGMRPLHLDRSGDESAEVREIFGDGASILLVRPDGYLGFRGSDRHTEQLGAYAQRMGFASKRE